VPKQRRGSVEQDDIEMRARHLPAQATRNAPNPLPSRSGIRRRAGIEQDGHVDIAVSSSFAAAPAAEEKSQPHLAQLGELRRESSPQVRDLGVHP
jgi:hypothetical protein